jgi:toxin ParE1/3/4
VKGVSRSKVMWSYRARNDLLDIGRYIARDDRQAARRWVEKLRLTAHNAAQSPLSGRRVPEIDKNDVREVILRSYRIVYRVVSDGIEVLTVFEGHRLLSDGSIDEQEQ